MKNDVRDYDWQLRLLELLLTIWESMCVEQVWGEKGSRKRVRLQQSTNIERSDQIILPYTLH